METLFIILIVMFDAVAALAIFLSAILAAYLGYRVIRGIGVYFRFRGIRLLTYPETHGVALAELAAGSMAIQAMLDEPCLYLGGCSRWPMRQDCGQDCLRQIEGHSSELRLSSAWRST